MTGGQPVRAGASPSGPTSGNAARPIVEYLLRLGDDRLVLGHRLSQWCGHGPILEEDIAMANFALDFVGQSAALLKLAGELEGAGRDEDALAYWRDEFEFRNCQLVELPIGDFAFTIVRQYLFDEFDTLLMPKLAASAHETLRGIASKAAKEAAYHVRHTREWLVRLGDGTAESHDRVQRALNELWPFAGELFGADDVDAVVVADGVGADVAALRSEWHAAVLTTLARATLVQPNDARTVTGGRRGRHTEFLGHMLAEMQILQRSHPGAKW